MAKRERRRSVQRSVTEYARRRTAQATAAAGKADNAVGQEGIAARVETNVRERRRGEGSAAVLQVQQTVRHTARAHRYGARGSRHRQPARMVVLAVKAYGEMLCVVKNKRKTPQMFNRSIGQTR